MVYFAVMIFFVIIFRDLCFRGYLVVFVFLRFFLSHVFTYEVILFSFVKKRFFRHMGQRAHQGSPPKLLNRDRKKKNKKTHTHTRIHTTTYTKLRRPYSYVRTHKIKKREGMDGVDMEHRRES